ncbi:MAG TPA: DUF58 domain-containing protein [Oculatellaceae cyanobacterium]
MKIVFSKLTFAVLTVIAAVYALSAWLPILKQLAFGADLLLLLAFIVDLQFTQRANKLTASRDVNERLSIGRQNLVTIRVSNTGTTPLHCLAKDDYPEVMEVDYKSFRFDLVPSGQAVLEYNLMPRRRGAYRLGNVTIRYRSLLHLFWRQVVFEIPKEIKVYSDLHALRELSLRLSRSSAQGEFHQRKRGHGTDFSSLREYAVGDPADKIDWKATARRERPIIRTYETEQDQRLIILVDAGRMMVSDLSGLTRFDHALNSALALALTGLSYNDQVGFGVFADKPLAYLPPRRGKNYLKKILETTHALEPRLVEPDYNGALAHFASLQKGRCLIVVFTDLIDPLGSKSLLQGLSSMSPRHLPFCVTLTDKQIAAKANSKLSSIEPEREGQLHMLFERAVALELLNQRELALSVLQRQGCLVLDCPPEELTTNLVNKYLQVKARNKL